MYNALKMTLKEATVASFQALSSICLQELRNNLENLSQYEQHTGAF
jgi:hypothetical protein